jgi:plasmid maintenance system killer protein
MRPNPYRKIFGFGLQGNRKDEWSVTIKLPWRITFKFKSGEFIDVKIENYH